MKGWMFCAVLVMFLYTRCSISSPCATEVIDQVENGSRTKKILIYELGCGANVTHHVSILPQSEYHTEEPGNIMRVEGSSLNAVWVNDSVVVITHREDAVIFKQESLAEGVRIIYEPLKPLSARR